MKSWVIICLIMISLTVLCTRVDAVEYGSDWKWSYAQTFVEDDLSKLNINAEDIAFANVRANASEKECVNMGGIWCEWAKNDSMALDRMIKAQSFQSTGPSTNIFKTAWDAIKKFFGL